MTKQLKAGGRSTNQEMTIRISVPLGGKSKNEIKSTSAMYPLRVMA